MSVVNIINDDDIDGEDEIRGYKRKKINKIRIINNNIYF